MRVAEATVPTPAAPERLRAQQFALSRHLRDPHGQPAPTGIEARRMAIYRDLLFNNIEALLAGNFPVIRALLGADGWPALVRAFYREHRCHTPLFSEIAREFVDFLTARAECDPPFLAELAHYEWVELALQIAEADVDVDVDVDVDGSVCDPRGDLLADVPVLSPLAWPFAYRWPVHRLGPGHTPAVAPDAPTLLLLRRERDSDGVDHVRFSELSPLAFRLLQRLDDASSLSGREHLEALGQEAAAPDLPAFIAQGAALLDQLRTSGVVLGSQRG